MNISVVSVFLEWSSVLNQFHEYKYSMNIIITLYMTVRI